MSFVSVLIELTYMIRFLILKRYFQVFMLVIVSVNCNTVLPFYSHETVYLFSKITDNLRDIVKENFVCIILTVSLLFQF